MDTIFLKLPVGWRRRNIGFRFSMLAWFELCEVYDIDIGDMGTLDPDKQLQGIIYGSAVAYLFSNNKRKPSWLTVDMAGRWMNDMTVEQAKKFSDAMLKSQPVKRASGEGEKKN